MLHYLRIAVTALSLTACVLLVALWVRSYYRLDTVGWWRGHTISSMKGSLFVDGQFGVIQSADYRHVFRFYAGTSVPIGATWEPYTNGTPIWFIALLFAVLAASLWLPWSKRFSLRTLLIATTLVAVGLGLIVAAT